MGSFASITCENHEKGGRFFFGGNPGRFIVLGVYGKDHGWLGGKYLVRI